MSKSIILILSFFAICHSQEFDYSKMSEAEKILVYSEMKKSPVAAGFLEIIPTAGYAYAGKWKRGAVVRLGINIGIPIGGAVGAALLSPLWKGTEQGVVWTFITLGFIATGYSFYDVVNQTSKYNKRLKRQIFGKKKKRMKASLYPLKDGAGISLSYSFN